MYTLYLSMALLMSLILGSGLAAFTSNNSALAQNYGYQDDYSSYGNNYYSTHPTDDKPYECRTGPLEGFFVSSVEFCKNVKFDDKDDKRDSKTGTQGPPGKQGPPGPSTINSTDVYVVVGDTATANLSNGIIDRNITLPSPPPTITPQQ
jgi:hypothetical protein